MNDHWPPGLESDVDARLVEVYRVVWGSPFEDGLDAEERDVLAALLRSAYACGYRDSLHELSRGVVGELLTTHNVTLI